MTELLTSAQMRAIEAAAIESGTVTGLALMERAGQGVVEAILTRWPDLVTAPGRAVVLCGPGNNGGDGYVIARLLHTRGWRVSVLALGDPARLPPDAQANHRRWCALGTVAPLGEQTVPSPGDPVPDLVVDALFGTGLSRPLDATLQSLLSHMGCCWPEPLVRHVAVDIPSGLCADSGRYLETEQRAGAFDPWIQSDLTVTFHAAKRGHYLGDGPDWCGEVSVCDIGLAPQHSHGADHVCLVTAVCAEDILKGGDGLGGRHKFDHGHALVLTGGMGRSGAARLAARAALRVGAGLVTLGAPGAATLECAAQITALMLRRIEDAEALRTALEDRRVSALCLGPGLGLDRARALVPVALEGSGASTCPTVLDADALTGFADHPEALFARLHDACVLTPHMGEFARLFPDLAAKLRAPATQGPAYSRCDAARDAAARAGCVVLLKGRDTVIAGPDGRVEVNAAAYGRAAPWLATAGSGDVLAGLITGLMARGLPVFQAAAAGAWLHVEAARAFGPGLIAEDLPETLPEVLRRLAESGHHGG